MKPLAEYVLENNSTTNESVINESIIGVGATIWALEKIAGIALTGVAITGGVIGAIIKANRRNKDLVSFANEIKILVAKYPELKDEEKCPWWNKLMSMEENENFDKFVKFSIDGPTHHLKDEARKVMNSEDFAGLERLFLKIRHL